MMRRVFSHYRKSTALLAVLFCSLTALALSPLHAQEATDQPQCGQHNLHCIGEKLAVGTDVLRTLPSVDVEVPTIPKVAHTVNYSIESRGTLSIGLAEFKAQTSQTLNNTQQGWAQLGIEFREVAEGGEFTFVLAEASQVPTFSPACDSTYSCRVGRYVIINEDRWLGATPSWNAAGGSLRGYRHMVVNHEVGHWLGHDHRNCPGAGQPAPLMQQQSIDLQGCTFNPWPLENELNSPTLGI